VGGIQANHMRYLRTVYSRPDADGGGFACGQSDGNITAVVHNDFGSVAFIKPIRHSVRNGSGNRGQGR
jgi:hypothetical protein